MKGTIKHEINNQAQAEYFEKWQKDIEKSMKEMCERINERMDCIEKEKKRKQNERN